MSFTFPTKINQIPVSIICVERVASSAFGRRILYQCPDSCWSLHFRSWQLARELARRMGEAMDEIPEPFPFNHVVFEDPALNGYRLVCLSLEPEVITSKCEPCLV